MIWLPLLTSVAAEPLAARDTRWGRVEVVEADGVRALTLDGSPQSAWRPDSPGMHVYAYTAVMLESAPETPGRALVIGLGGGTLPRLLTERGWTVDAVEINRTVARYARRYFALPRSVRVHIADAQHFVNREGSWDLVILDAASEAGFAPSLFTVSFYEDLGALSDRILVNSWSKAPWADDELATWWEIGPVAVIPVRGTENRVLALGHPTLEPTLPRGGIVLDPHTVKTRHPELQ